LSTSHFNKPSANLTQEGCRFVLQLLLGLLLGIGGLDKASAREQLFQPYKHGLGELRYIGGLPVVQLEGTPQEIGEQHAALLAKPAVAVLKYPKKLFVESGAEKVWPMAVGVSKRLLNQAPQRYRIELAAATQHADLDGDEVAVANTLLEMRRLGCSTLIVEPARSQTDGPLLGRNFDFPSLGLLEKFNLVMIVRPEGHHAFAAVGYPGLIGVLSGMNDAGLALATLDVYEAGNKSPQLELTGVPLLLVFRQILEECTTVDEAEALLKRTQATTWANLAVCDCERGAVFEITPTEVARRDASGAILPCTNHFREEGLAVNTQCWRYDSLQSAVHGAKLDIEDIHQHLHKANQGDLTLQTLIFEPRELVLHLAFGKPPSSALPLKRLDLGELLHEK